MKRFSLAQNGASTIFDSTFLASLIKNLESRNFLSAANPIYRDYGKLLLEEPECRRGK